MSIQIYPIASKYCLLLQAHNSSTRTKEPNLVCKWLKLTSSFKKIDIGTKISPYPMPVVLVGSVVHEKPNFMTVAWLAKLNGNPPIWGIAIGKEQYTLKGIRENKGFSINFPSTSMVVKTDYCGIVSGAKVDKSDIFEVFWGKMGVPMIKECPLCIECRLYDTHDLPGTILCMGEVVGAYTDERFQTDGKLDTRKMMPFILTIPENEYWAIGEEVGKAFSVGKSLKVP